MMTFNKVMALVMPSFVAFLFYTKIRNFKGTLLEDICTISLFLLITNCIGYMIMIFFFNIETLIFTTSFTMKYSIMATLIASTIAVIYRFFELNVKINLKVKSNEKND